MVTLSGFLFLFCIAREAFAAQTLVVIESDRITIRQVSTPVCSTCALVALFADFCPIDQELTTAQMVERASNASLHNMQPFTFDELVVCCSATSLPGLMLDLVRYSNIKEISLSECKQDFSTSQDDIMVIYGLEKLTIQSDTSTDYPRNTMILSQTDESDTTIVYRDYNIAYLHRNLLDGSKQLGSYSTILQIDNSKLSSQMIQDLQRSPTQLKEKGDSTFMATVLFGK